MSSPLSRLLKYLFVAILLIVGVIGIAFYSLPKITLTNWGHDKALTLINQTIPGNVEAKRIELSWFGEQKFHDVQLISPNGETVLSLGSLITSTPLYRMLGGNFSGATKVGSLNFALYKTATGDSNLEAALGISDISLRQMSQNNLSVSDVNLAFSVAGTDWTLLASGKSKERNQSGHFDLNLNYTDGKMNGSADVTNFPVSLLDSALSFQHMNTATSFKDLFGPSIDLKINESYEGDLLNLNFHGKSTRIAFDFDAIYDGQQLSLKNPAKLTLPLTNEVIATFTDDTLRVKQPGNLSLIIKEMKVNPGFFTGAIDKAIAFNAEMKISPLAIYRKDFTQDITELKGFQISIDAGNETSQLIVHSQGTLNDQPFTLTLQSDKPRTIEQLIRNLQQPNLLTGGMDNFKTVQLEALTGWELSNTVGQQVSVSMSAAANQPNLIMLQIDTDKFVAENMKLTLDQSLQGLKFPQNLSGKLTTERLRFKGTPDNSLVKGFTVTWKTPDFFETISANLSGQTPGGQFQGQFIKGQNSEFTIALDGENMPTQLLSIITGHSELSPILGDTVDADIDIKLQNNRGPFRAHLTGKNGKLRLNGQATNYQLTLIDPLIIESKVTPELTAVVLKEFAPVFGDLISGDRPLRLEVSPSNFSYPLDPYDVRKVNIEEATLEFGKLIFKNQGEVRTLMGVLQSPRSEEISVWTTPLHLQFHDGILGLYRMDMLLMNRYPIATWGKIDFANDNMNVVVGLSGQTLERAFSISGLSKDYMLQLPIKGKVDRAKIDKSKAATEIAAIVAKKTGRPEGMLVGTILDIANGKKHKVPPPTTTPLPWETNK